MNSENEGCYLCGTAENLTREHIPPRCLFPKPRPNNLHTVPCCYSCNNSASQDDEYFRLVTCMLVNGNAKAKKSWARVLESTLPAGRIRDRISELGSSMKPITVETPGGFVAGSQAHIDVEPINRCLVRITKGIIATCHPEVNRYKMDFEITQIDQFKPDLILSSGVAEKFTPWSVGDGVYRSWRAVDRDNVSRGMMVHMFYDASIWMVKFGLGTGRVTVYGIDDWSHEAPGTL